MKQRQLTQEEIDIAPEWATHYLIAGGDFNDVLFESDYYYQWSAGGLLKVKTTQVNSGISRDAQPIPRKAFDISEHEFSDDDIESAVVRGGKVYIDFADSEIRFVGVNKADSIAIAKALGVTAEDF